MVTRRAIIGQAERHTGRLLRAVPRPSTTTAAFVRLCVLFVLLYVSTCVVSLYKTTPSHALEYVHTRTYIDNILAYYEHCLAKRVDSKGTSRRHSACFESNTVDTSGSGGVLMSSHGPNARPGPTRMPPFPPSNKTPINEPHPTCYVPYV